MQRIIFSALVGLVGLSAWSALASANDDSPVDGGQVVTDLRGPYDVQSVQGDTHVGWLTALGDGRVVFRDDPDTDVYLDADEVFYAIGTNGFRSASGKLLFFKLYDDGLFWHVFEAPATLKDCGPLISRELRPDDA
jgi:hypothetical protein